MDIAGFIAFATLIAAQLLAVVAVHGARTDGGLPQRDNEAPAPCPRTEVTSRARA